MLSAALYARVRLTTLLHTRPRVQRAPGIPCALFLQEVRKLRQTSGASRREIAESFSSGNYAVKQSFVISYGAAWIASLRSQ